MRELIGKFGRLCENHVEKIVLVIAGIVSGWLFFTGVIFSSDTVSYEGHTFTPGQVDAYVAKKVEKLREARSHVNARTEGSAYVGRLTGPIEPNDPVIAVLGSRPLPKSFASLFESPLRFLAVPTAPERPGPTLPSGAVAKYRLPPIPRLTDVAVGYMRTAAYVPRLEVTPERAYANSEPQLDDIDLVTVEGKFDIAELFRKFKAYFVGTEVQKEEWRNPSLAKPVFAALPLERQELLGDGSWSDWASVPRARVCPYKQQLTIIEHAKDLPVGGIAIRMIQFDNRPVTMEILQPQSYQIASPDEEWFPPSFHDRFKTLERKVEEEEKRKEREEARNQAETSTSTRRGENTRTGTTTQGLRGTTGQGSGVRGPASDSRSGTGDSRLRGGATDTQTARGTAQSSRRGAGRGADASQQPSQTPDQTKPAASTTEAYIDFAKHQVVPDTDLSALTDPLPVWAIDDTAVPGKTYRYRMRIGLFNPVAGTDQVADRDNDKKDQVILWSEYSPITAAVEVPKMTYIFAKNVDDRTKTASVEVARYLYGYWRTADFQVHRGETIGKEVETPKKERKDKKTTADATGRITAGMTRPEDFALAGGASRLGLGLGTTTADDSDEANPAKVDFTTHAMVVDLTEVSEWAQPQNAESRLPGTGPSLRLRAGYDLLYTEDGTRIEHMPVNLRTWPREMSEVYSVISVEALKDHKALRKFDASRTRISGAQGSLNGPYLGPQTTRR